MTIRSLTIRFTHEQRIGLSSAHEGWVLPMDARSELASVLRGAADAAIAAGVPVLTHDGNAEAAIAAGWRPPPKVIIDPAELDDLPEDTAILDALGVSRQLHDNLWAGAASGSLTAEQVPLPATVLHTPA
jgi:hypothetical protein